MRLVVGHLDYNIFLYLQIPRLFPEDYLLLLHSDYQVQEQGHVSRYITHSLMRLSTYILPSSSNNPPPSPLLQLAPRQCPSIGVKERQRRDSTTLLHLSGDLLLRPFLRINTRRRGTRYPCTGTRYPPRIVTFRPRHRR